MPRPSPSPAGSELPHPARTQLPTTSKRVIETAALLFENIVYTSPWYPSLVWQARDACPYPRPDSLLKILQNLEQRIVVRQFVDVVNVCVTDDSFLVHDERRPFSIALGTKDTILLGHFPLGPEITQQKNVFHSQRLGPGGVGSCAVHAYTQNLGIYRLEACQIGFEGGDFL